MSNPNKVTKNAVYRVLVGDLLVVFIALAIIHLLAEQYFRSVMVGFLVFLIPQAMFTWLIFRHVNRLKIELIGQSFYRAESVKFLLTAGLFTYSFVMLQPINAACIFIAYISLMVVNILLSITFVGSNRPYREL